MTLITLPISVCPFIASALRQDVITHDPFFHYYHVLVQHLIRTLSYRSARFM
jgi:hypothetical protein